MKLKNILLIALVLINCLNQILAQPCKEIVGYYPNWQWYDRAKLVQPNSISYQKYSIINYCFFKPEANGLVSNTDSWADENLLQGQINWSTTPVSYYPNTSIIDLAHNAGTKVLVSIGGWSLSNNFPVIASNPSLRATFSSECNRLLQFYKFDGIDIDWEYPGYAAHGGTAADKVNFTLLMQQIRDSITALGIKNGKNYLLSSCFGASKNHASNIQWNQVSAIVDMINVMSYDFFGAWDCQANHNSPLKSCGVGDPTFNLDSIFYYLTNIENISASKINLGLAFYGRSQTGATALYQSTNCGEDNITFSDDLGTPLYYNIQKNMSLFDTYWDSQAEVPYLLGKSSGSAFGTFLSYDNKKSIGLKASYILSHSARGAIIWEITGDYIETIPGSGIIASTPLVDTLNQVFCSISTGIESNTIEDLILFPNPANEFIKLNGLSAKSKVVIGILSLSGEELLQSSFYNNQEIIIKTNNFSNGIYIMKVQNGLSVTYRKFIITH